MEELALSEAGDLSRHNLATVAEHGGVARDSEDLVESVGHVKHGYAAGRHTSDHVEKVLDLAFGEGRRRLVKNEQPSSFLRPGVDCPRYRDSGSVRRREASDQCLWVQLKPNLRQRVPNDPAGFAASDCPQPRGKTVYEPEVV